MTSLFMGLKIGPVPCPGLRRTLTLLLSAISLAQPIIAAAATADDYARADRIRSFDNRRIGGAIFPHWLPDGRSFYYRSFADDEQPGTIFLVDPAKVSKRALFTLAGLATALSKASRTNVDHDQLPAWRLTDASTVVARVGAEEYRCVVATMVCRATPSPVGESVPQWAVRSPDGKWDAFVWNYNLYVRPSDAAQGDGTSYRAALSDSDGNYAFPMSGDSEDIASFRPTGQRGNCDWRAPAGPVVTAEPDYMPPPAGAIALTQDGSRLYSYGPRWKLGAEHATLDADRYRPTRASMTWSPDSSKLLVRREDLRGVGVYPLYSSTSDQPVDHSYFYAAPGADHIPQYDLFVVDVAARSAVKMDVPPTGTVLAPGGAQWTQDSQRLHILSSNRGPTKIMFSAVEAATGQAKPLIVETSKTYVEMGNGGRQTIVAVSPTGKDIIWFSERDGWGHLYLYGADGKLRNQIDKGANSVAELIRVDFARKLIYFTAMGRAAGNPYDRHLYRVGFDGRGLTALTPEDGDHGIAFAPDGSYFLDRHQSITTPPVTTARAPDGRALIELSRGHDTALRAIGWRPAETFSVKARDGKTDLYGVMYKPSDFDPAKHYPIVVNIYPGPFMGSVGANWTFQGGDNIGPREQSKPRVTHGEGMSQSLAELGFIVIKLNSLGTAQRSKTMQDYFYGNAIDNGLPDQIAAIRQLAKRYAWIDADRAGITGHSGGGFAAAAGLLTHPEAFKVGVAQAGNHDFRTYGWYWGEQYMGPLKTQADRVRYAQQANASYAANLKGKLMLVHGDMDCNNPPAQTLRLVDALTNAGKDFDLLMVPEAGHQLPSYVMRRSWDYFVTNLAGQPAPTNYPVTEPGY
ncbi:S9 family peptidase [Sphingobium sp.]|uniref:S9 family peptidase n=1 Tax=Sphingobium sp. TaxID=1912891 RepID=UPI002BAFBE1D|nr:DPP IV N-terminal domain-containing protein [Sphingobium sp.]HUD92481.1 DPP IV N-terminal domain-containing protein [Sphingobium sp.]